ncbi:MAG TPA: redox-sensing transcriptional repressor Rex [Sedimentisphaerales bacterium]|nr:redox-sensing transcriptional repressor Rex [Sedimentisphaerales bacterium]
MANRSCIIRLSRYKNAIIRLKSLNFVRVFSDNLADAVGVTPSQVRKDFSIFGITGNKRGGYQIDTLLEQLNSILGKDSIQKIIVVGIGNIGKALLRYSGFAKSGIKIIAGFDIDPAKYNKESEVPILGLEVMAEYIKANDIKLAILSVPDFAAQQVLELLLPAGIKGILNFAPICLRGPQDCVINNINIEMELENVIYFVNVSGKTRGS